MSRVLQALAVFCCVFAPTQLAAETLVGKVVAVKDGDSFALGEQRREIHIQGIDAPDRGQRHSEGARKALEKLILDKMVRVRVARRDLDGVTGVVYVGSQKVGDVMLAEGWAWRYFHNSSSNPYSRLQRRARSSRKGLWAASDPEPPWEWRSRPKEEGDIVELSDITPSAEEIDDAEQGLVDRLEIEAVLNMNARQSKVFRTRIPVARFTVTTPRVVRIVQYTPTEFEVVGGRDGETTLNIWFGDSPRDRQVLRYLVRVSSE